MQCMCLCVSHAPVFHTRFPDLTNVCNHHCIWCGDSRSLLLLDKHWCCSRVVQHDNICLFPVSDWETLNWAKMAALIDNSTQFTYGMGLVPWYLPGYILPAGTAADICSHMQCMCMTGIANGTPYSTCVNTAYSVPHCMCVHTADMQRTACVTAQNQELVPEHCNAVTMLLLQKLDVSTLICMVSPAVCTVSSRFPPLRLVNSMRCLNKDNSNENLQHNTLSDVIQCVLQGTQPLMPPTLQSHSHHDELQSSLQPKQLPQFQPLHQLCASHTLNG